MAGPARNVTQNPSCSSYHQHTYCPQHPIRAELCAMSQGTSQLLGMLFPPVPGCRPDIEVSSSAALVTLPLWSVS
jgi:hypothetical protein